MLEPPVLLRPGALSGRTVSATPGSVVATTMEGLGATLAPLPGSPADVLVVDAGGPFGAGGDEALRAGLDETWDAIHGWFAEDHAGKVVLLGPRPAAGPRAEALRAGLENLARTLSVEWSRFGIRIVTLLPGPQTDDDELAQLVAYLASEAGDYFSGATMTLT